MGSLTQKSFIDLTNTEQRLTIRSENFENLPTCSISLNTQVESPAKALVLEGKCEMMEILKLKK